MRVSDHSACQQVHQSNQKTAFKRRRTGSPVRSLSASYACQSQRDARDDVILVSQTVATDSFPRESPPPFILSPLADLFPSSEESIWEVRACTDRYAECKARLAQADLLLSFAATSWDDASVNLSSPSVSSRHVNFAPQLVTVVEIPSHRSLTQEEKHRIYRDRRIVRRDRSNSRLEQKFERRCRCFDNVLEEDVFFRNELGELVHPAHFALFVRHVLPTVSRATFVPGFASADEYHGEIARYGRFYSTAVQQNVFPSSSS